MNICYHNNDPLSGVADTTLHSRLFSDRVYQFVKIIVNDKNTKKLIRLMSLEDIEQISIFLDNKSSNQVVSIISKYIPKINEFSIFESLINYYHKSNELNLSILETLQLSKMILMKAGNMNKYKSNSGIAKTIIPIMNLSLNSILTRKVDKKRINHNLMIGAQRRISINNKLLSITHPNKNQLIVKKEIYEKSIHPIKKEELAQRKELAQKKELIQKEEHKLIIPTQKENKLMIIPTQKENKLMIIPTQKEEHELMIIPTQKEIDKQKINKLFENIIDSLIYSPTEKSSKSLIQKEIPIAGDRWNNPATQVFQRPTKYPESQLIEVKFISPESI